ncbi:hypothetical protein EVAR_28554_1 [Eumeta japonica]|uniref:Uncharacterized protein n=1 Tax=Eumeta variegata TaxID=151549 RepID=A0A4C1UYP5_EUMVA|nr:hypothetical protein EVAR_28554_1 [Eumeta japonica]
MGARAAPAPAARINRIDVCELSSPVGLTAAIDLKLSRWSSRIDGCDRPEAFHASPVGLTSAIDLKLPR